ncbi:EF-hand domain-containing protein [Hyphomicrobium sp.]|uniref:EF-hand domain-containing protein n=1 Tax=Hyphomicrobium sp. TaxID=82 RepID=UPI002D79643B|nr:EF-hand domain-containing protein [Hyphomicrobium sp.]HET6387815.1 EF-hand domain-containing protein [Hyphomicrobium sp.]
MGRSLIVWFFIVLSCTVGAITWAQAQTPLGEDECADVWKKAGGGRDLGPDQAKPFIKNFVQLDVDKNGSIDWEEFKAGCANGLVTKG